MRAFMPTAMLGVAIALMTGSVGAQVPQPTPDKVYPNPDSTPGGLIQPPGMAPKPEAPKSAPTTQAQKEPDQAPVKLDIGAVVIGSDDRNIGRIRNIAAEPGGWVKEIHVKIEELDGVAGKTVVVRAGHFGRAKDGIRLSIPSTEVSKLPVIPDQPG